MPRRLRSHHDLLIWCDVTGWCYLAGCDRRVQPLNRCWVISTQAVFLWVCGTGRCLKKRPNIDPFCQGNLNMFEHLLSGALRNRGNFAPKNGPNKSCHVCFTHKRTTQDHPGPRSLVHGILKLSLRWASKNHVLSNNLIVWKDHLIWELHLSFFGT